MKDATGQERPDPYLLTNSQQEWEHWRNHPGSISGSFNANRRVGQPAGWVTFGTAAARDAACHETRGA